MFVLNQHRDFRSCQYLGSLSFLVAYVGLPERVLEFQERSMDAGYNVSANSVVIWGRDYAPARKTERFKTLVRKMGLVDNWRGKGWPQYCHPTTGDDFACN